jgi:hypothetical protein
MRQCGYNIAMYTCLMLYYWTLLFLSNYLNKFKLDNSNFFGYGSMDVLFIIEMYVLIFNSTGIN